MIRAVLLLAIVSASVTDASARMVKGAGMASCGEWLQSRKSDPNLFQFQMCSWIDGYTESLRE
jgi:hypothetical protein